MPPIVRRLRIAILVDDQATNGLTAEHGFSLWVEADDQRILFDTGLATALLTNADRMGISLNQTDHLVLSHGHDDHTGGIKDVLSRSPDVHVHCHPAAVLPRYTKRGDQLVSLAMPAAARRALGDMPPERLDWTTGSRSLFPGVGITGPIPRLAHFEEAYGHYLLDADGTAVDQFEDDMALWLNTSEGLVVCVGCCHAGLVNTLNSARRCSHTSHLHAVIGGFHLLRASDERLQCTLAALTELRPDLIIPCHCTGNRFVEALRLEFGGRVSAGRAGATYVFGGSIDWEKIDDENRYKPLVCLC